MSPRATKKQTTTAKPSRAARPAKPKQKAAVRATTRAVPSVPAPRRRAVFIDVENTSSEVDLLRVIDELKIDRAAQPTEVTAAGNWKSVGQKLARRLAGLGAQLVHSAPAIGVRDWSDLWIAVAAGCWLGQAQPGDRLDIISDDRAFDAVGDAAAARGVDFHRISYRTSSSVSHSAWVKEPTQRRSRRGGRHRRPVGEHPVRTQPPASAPKEPDSAAAMHGEGHAASHEQIIDAVARLSGGSSGRWVNLDMLANALKTEGFTRPPGSPRLVTRVRKLKELEVSSNGMVRLRTASGSGEASTTPPPPKRSRRRGGRGRRRPGQAIAPPAAEAVGAPEASTDGQS